MSEGKFNVIYNPLGIIFSQENLDNKEIENLDTFCVTTLNLLGMCTNTICSRDADIFQISSQTISMSQVVFTFSFNTFTAPQRGHMVSSIHVVFLFPQIFLLHTNL